MRSAAVFLFVIALCTEMFPCTCLAPYPAKNMREVAEGYIKRADVALLFEGKVIKQEVKSGSAGAPATAMSMTGAGQFRVVDFAVSRVFRGNQQGQVSAVTGLGAGDCGFDFQTGQNYLVFASKTPSGTWFTSICSGTQNIDEAGTALRVLTGMKPTPEDLLSPEEHAKNYYEKVLPKKTGSVCGEVLKRDGTPLKGALVTLWELRNDDLPSRSASDQNGTSDKGHFCIEHVEPARYLLTAERTDFDHNARYMAFYAGVPSQAEAVPLDIKPGARLPDVKFTALRESLYTIRIRVATPDGTRLSYKNGCGVMVDSEYSNPLSYHISHMLEEDGTYRFGFAPAGNYIVTTYFMPDLASGEERSFPEAARWKPVQQHVVVSGDTDVVIHMERAKPN